MKRKEIHKLISDAARPVQLAVNQMLCKSEEEPSLGLRDGEAIIRELLDHGESGEALEHIVYMLDEIALEASGSTREAITKAAHAMGLSRIEVRFGSDV